MTISQNGNPFGSKTIQLRGPLRLALTAIRIYIFAWFIVRILVQDRGRQRYQHNVCITTYLGVNSLLQSEETSSDLTVNRSTGLSLFGVTDP